MWWKGFNDGLILVRPKSLNNDLFHVSFTWIKVIWTVFQRENSGDDAWIEWIIVYIPALYTWLSDFKLTNWSSRWFGVKAAFTWDDGLVLSLQFQSVNDAIVAMIFLKIRISNMQSWWDELPSSHSRFLAGDMERREGWPQVSPNQSNMLHNQNRLVQSHSSCFDSSFPPRRRLVWALHWHLVSPHDRLNFH